MQEIRIAKRSFDSEAIMAPAHWMDFVHGHEEYRELVRRKRTAKKPVKMEPLTAQVSALTTKVMMMGICLSLILCAADLAAALPSMSWPQQISLSMAFGGAGMMSLIGIYGLPGIKHPAQEIAQAFCASVPTAGAASPIVSFLFVKFLGPTFGVEDSPWLMLIVTAWLVGMGGPYLIKTFGRVGLDTIGEAAIKKIKRTVDDPEKS